MRNLIFAAAMVFGSSAFAADLPPPVMPPAAPGLVVSPSSGLYFGVNAGGAFTKDRVDFVTIPGAIGTLHPAGGMAGVTLGYTGWNGGLVYGVEADLDLDYTKGSGTCGGLPCTTKNSLFATQRVIVGAALPAMTGALAARGVAQPSQWPVPLSLPASAWSANIAPYLTVGMAERDVRASVDGGPSHKQWIVGPVFGAGIRIPVSANLSLDAHYLYANFNKTFGVGNVLIFPVTAKGVSEQMVRAAAIFHY